MRNDPRNRSTFETWWRENGLDFCRRLNNGDQIGKFEKDKLELIVFHAWKSALLYADGVKS
jgi:hypothetical protein